MYGEKMVPAKSPHVLTTVLLILMPIVWGPLTGATITDTADNSMNAIDNSIKDAISRDIDTTGSRGNTGLADTPWPMFRHDLNHSGISTYNTSNNNGQKKWELTTGFYVYSSPVLGADNTIYIGSYDAKFYALYPNGTVKWNFTTKDLIGSTAAISSDGTIYVGSLDGNLYAFDPNGTLKWDFTTGGYVYSSPAIGPDGTIYFGSRDHKLYALFPNGTKKWDFLSANGIDSSPAIGSDGTIYVGSNDTKLYAINPNGTEKWYFDTGDDIYSSPGIGPDGTIYVGSLDGKLYSVYPNGTKKWAFDLGHEIYSSPGIGSDGTIYVGSTGGGLYAVHPNGTLKWKFSTVSGVYSTPSISSDKTIYFGCGDNILYALYPNGTKKGEFPTQGKITSSAAIGSDNTVYFGSYDNNFYAVGTTKPTTPPVLHAVGSNGTIDLSWSPPSDDGGPDITNYLIFKGTTSGGKTFLAQVGNVLTYHDTDVTNGKKYYYEIIAKNILGESPRSNEASATPSSVPSAPRNLNATARKDRIVLTWTAPAYDGGSSVLNYNIYRGTTSGGELLAVMGYTGGMFYVDTNIIVGTNYYYEVSAVNAIGEGPRSNEHNATVLKIINPPGVPTGLTAKAGNAKVLVRWFAPTSGGTVDHYNVYRSDTMNGTYTLIASPVEREHVDIGLKNGHTYWYKVNAQNSDGISGNTTAVPATPSVSETAVSPCCLSIFLVIIIILILVIVGYEWYRRKKVDP